MKFYEYFIYIEESYNENIASHYIIEMTKANSDRWWRHHHCIGEVIYNGLLAETTFTAN